MIDQDFAVEKIQITAGKRSLNTEYVLDTDRKPMLSDWYQFFGSSRIPRKKKKRLKTMFENGNFTFSKTAGFLIPLHDSSVERELAYLFAQ